MAPKKKVLSAKVTTTLQKEIVRLAEEEKRPVSNLISVLLEEALEVRKSRATA